MIRHAAVCFAKAVSDSLFAKDAIKLPQQLFVLHLCSRQHARKTGGDIRSILLDGWPAYYFSTPLQEIIRLKRKLIVSLVHLLVVVQARSRETDVGKVPSEEQARVTSERHPIHSSPILRRFEMDIDAGLDLQGSGHHTFRVCI
jgi:hypothetical protein